MPEFQDRVITCVDCGQSFVHSAGAQEFYAQKGFTSDPKRCPDCRRMKKEKGGGGAAGGGHMGGGRPARSSTSDNDALFNTGRGGGGDRGGDRGGYGGGPREMFTATCAECGVETQVPFKPRGDRPVYCRDCYQSKRTR
jgi:CxxC-x17-CxxC domain-containing protein